MGVKINWVQAGQVVSEDRNLLHGWATRNPFSLATVIIVFFLVLIFLNHLGHRRSLEECRSQAPAASSTGG